MAEPSPVVSVGRLRPPSDGPATAQARLRERQLVLAVTSVLSQVQPVEVLQCGNGEGVLDPLLSVAILAVKL
ncbi:hypothetical protein SBRY_50465 [Actinacidiphila bryophytorum]|uniref:Uncharacterized protein n=1 Tax=Actinacidiphila bryophytorum TaxID=1436133 RepID=A0A9W4H4V4_9ACTN|nr:hypothetical protein SBRY_50465 [Actinacidiphila bryophytorum]